MRAVFISILFVLLASKSSGQFVIDAGDDAKMCNYFNTVKLGGNPSASGGTAPYTYQWKCRFYHQYPPLPVQYIIDNPASPNPAINAGCYFLNDTIEFYLTVTDTDNNILKDSVNVIISTFSILTVENGVTINIGDSAQISPRNVVGGISPFTYLWSPSAGLSDPLIEKPWAKPPVSTSYSVKVTDAIGCNANDYCWVEVRTTGIDANEVKNAPEVYPEPINYSSVIHLNDPSLINLTIKVYNQDGRFVFSDRFYQDYRIGEKISAPGLYFYRILDGNKPVSGGKIIKL
jgi:hypothetical protein